MNYHTSKRVSILDVARKAKVSSATVSRTFSHPDMVSPMTRNRVLEASRALNFSISRTPGLLKSGRSYRIALLVGDTRIEWYTAEVMEGLMSVFTPAGYDLTMVPITGLAQRKQFFSQLPLRNNVDGVVVSSFRVNPEEVRELRTMNVPIVGINVSSSAGFSATNSIDDRKGVELLVHHLVTLGHRSILYVYENFHSQLSYSSMRRIRAFSAVCAQTPGVKPSMLDITNTQDSFEAVMNYLMGTNDPPTAICFHQDSLAIPFFITLARQGIKIPQQLSITGFDDSTFAQAAGLTTIHQDPRQQGAKAAQATLNLIDEKQLSERNITAPTRLIIRSSTAAPRSTVFFSQTASQR